MTEKDMRKYMHKGSEDKELDPMDVHPRTVFFKKDKLLQSMENIDSRTVSEEKIQESIPIENNQKKSLEEIIDKAIEQTRKKPTTPSVPKILEKYTDPQKSEEVINSIQKEILNEKKEYEQTKQKIEIKSQSLKKARTALMENQKKLDTVLATDLQEFENKRLEVIGKMSSKMAHDIRNPLSVLKIQVDLMKLKQKKQEDEIMSSSITRMEKAITDITNQISDVLTFIRQPNLELISCDLKDIVNNSIEQLQIPDNITLTQLVDSCTLRCDMTKIKGIITNILHNSIQAINNEKGEISISVQDVDRTVEIKITDSGPGIPDTIPVLEFLKQTFVKVKQIINELESSTQ